MIFFPLLIILMTLVSFISDNLYSEEPDGFAHIILPAYAMEDQLEEGDKTFNQFIDAFVDGTGKLTVTFI
jgi:hypothetical protein